MSIENDLGRIAASLERIAKVMEANAQVVETSAPVAAVVPTTKSAKKEKAASVVSEVKTEPQVAVDLGETAAVPTYTLEQVADGLRQVIAKDKNSNIKAIELMCKYGASAVKPMVKDIKPSNFTALMADINAYLA